MKSLAEAQFPGVTFTNEQIQRVWEARSLCSMNLQSDGYLAKGSPMKEQAQLLLRMMASPDAAEVMAEYCMPHSYYPVDATEADYQFVADTNRMVVRMENFTFNNYKLGLRNETSAGMFGTMNLNLCTKIMAEIGVVEDPKDRNYAALAESYFNQIEKNITDNWADFLKKAGY